MRRRLWGGEGIAFAVLILICLALFVVPLGLLARVAVGEGFAAISAALDSRSVPRAIWNSFESAALSALLALIGGTLAALVMGLTDIRLKGLLTFLLLVPMMVPPHVTAIAWVQALGPSSALLQLLGIAPEVGSTHPLYSRQGVIFLLGIQHAPLVFLVVLAALRSLPREMSDAARVAGARPGRLLTRILLPLLAPTLIAGYALAFVSALGNFGIPALLGIPARYTTLPVLIWQRLASFGPSVLTDMAVIASLVALIAVAAVVFQMWLAGRRRNALIGPPQPPLDIKLHGLRIAVECAVVLVILATLVLPITALFATALVPTYGVPLTRDTVTFENFAEILFRQSVTARAFMNSTLVASVAAVVIAILATFVARYAAARHGITRRIGTVMTALAEMTYAIPGLVISVAFILAFIRPLPVLGFSIYNTLTIILLAYLCAFFSIALKPVTAATLQLDQSLDEAARVAGAGFYRRMTRITFPLIAPAAASGAILVFLTAYNEVTVSALLWSSGTETIGTTIFNYEDGGYTTLASAMAAVTIIATVFLMVVLDYLGRRAPPGVVPWRL
ncbi:iron ABC transporter permease [Actibacterium sp. 188UL27-1]|uniref:ABC transporter permease n=1 Tax=Actibacterium sp. 188UL27-1 TaxID=2786961 RepID=UPI00195B9CAF|nr:iron ABC transporter permease [Actibacterium sp. 188UL27-1]MBM7066299.1 iron ABC transporter permease [Actibacterium sp. 188UL27-1]